LLDAGGATKETPAGVFADTTLNEGHLLCISMIETWLSAMLTVDLENLLIRSGSKCGLPVPRCSVRARRQQRRPRI
jgi:hypothetical protein